MENIITHDYLRKVIAKRKQPAFAPKIQIDLPLYRQKYAAA